MSKNTVSLSISIEAMQQSSEGEQMNKRVAIYKRIGDLLDGCKGCPKNWGYTSPKVRCMDCTAYRQMRRLGDSLIKDESGRLKLEATLTVAEYKEMRQTMKTDSKICLETGIERADLRERKKQHTDELADIPMSGPKAGSKTSPNAKLGKKLSDELKAAKAEIKRLKTLLDEQATIDPAFVGKTDAEYKEMKDKLLANIRELTAQLEKATTEAKSNQEQIESLGESNHLFEKRMNELQSDLDKVEQLETEVANLKSQLEQEHLERKDALIDAGKLVAENNELKQQVEYYRKNKERETKYSDDLLTERNQARAMLMKLEAFCMEKFKAEIAADMH